MFEPLYDFIEGLVHAVDETYGLGMREPVEDNPNPTVNEILDGEYVGVAVFRDVEIYEARDLGIIGIGVTPRVVDLKDFVEGQLGELGSGLEQLMISKKKQGLVDKYYASKI